MLSSGDTEYVASSDWICFFFVWKISFVHLMNKETAVDLTDCQRQQWRGNFYQSDFVFKQFCFTEDPKRLVMEFM